MPIKTLKQQTQFLGKAFPTLVRLAKGEMQGNRPVDLDYFKPDNFLNDAVKHAFIGLYGEKPTSFGNVQLLGNTPDSIAPAWMEAWGKSSGLNRRCDGEVMELYRDESGTMQNEPRACACALAGEVTCKPTMYLSLILPDLINASGQLGIVRLTLHAARELSHILTVLQAQPAVIGLNVADCRWQLTRQPESVTTIINDKPAKKEMYFVKLALDMDATFANRPPMLASSETLTLSDPETGEIIEEESTPLTVENYLNMFCEQVEHGNELIVGWWEQDFDLDQLEELLLDELANTETPIKASVAKVIENAGKLYYALDFGFNRNKQVILLKTEMQKGDKAGKQVTFKGLQTILQKTKGGNYAATPI